MFVNKHSTFLEYAYSMSKKKGVIMRNLWYTIFYLKKNISADFRICISAPLSFISGRTLNFAQDVACPWLISSISKERIISPWYSEG